MKSAILAILFPFAAVAAALTPDTIKDDIPGTATIREIVTAGDGTVTNKRDKTDYRTYRMVKDCWLWTAADGDTPTPADFIETANLANRDPIFYDAGLGGWFGATQYWPNGKRKYLAGLPPGGATSTNLNFAFTAYAPDGVTETARFRAMAVRQSATDETLVWWDNPYVRVVTTDELDMRVGHATNAIRRVDGTARMLPKYLWRADFSDSYESDAKWYYDREDATFTYVPGLCSARRKGNVLERNYDWYYDESAEFVVLMNAGPGRYASVGVANIGTNLTEGFVTSGAPSRFYKCLPGRTVDGVNARGVAIEVNVVPTNGVSQWEHHVPGDGRDIDSRWAVRFVLDNAANAGWAASNLADRVYVAPSMLRRGYSVHFAIVDRDSTWLVEDGKAIERPASWPLVMTNFRLDTTPSRIMTGDPYGAGYERYWMLTNAAVSITNAWYSNAYRRMPGGDFPWPTEFAGETNASGRIVNTDTEALQDWAKANIPVGAPEVFPRGVGTWQTVHTSVYDLTNRTLRVCVQEIPDWYTFSVPSSGGVKPEAVRDIVQPMIGEAIEANEKTGTNQQVVRGRRDDDGIVQIDVRGAVTAGRANSSNTADADAFGDAIHETYAKKTELSSKFDKIGGKIGPDDDDSASLSFGNRQGDALLVRESGGAMFSTSVEIRGFGGATLSVESDDNDHPASITKDGKEVATEEYVDNHVSPPSPTLRLYDEVLDCWWIIKIVNGVMTREVE